MNTALIQITNRLLSALEFLYERVLAYIAAMAMFLMMMITLVDVVGRDMFSFPLPGDLKLPSFC